MKKIYEKPELLIVYFDLNSDVITSSFDEYGEEGEMVWDDE